MKNYLMKWLSDKEYDKLSYQDRCAYLKGVYDYKFSDVPVGTPMVHYHRSGRIEIFELREHCTYDMNFYVYGKCSSMARDPREVEVATIDEINAFIEYKRNDFNNVIKYYEGLKGKVHD